jgi:polyhydroxybutyrate depolymerase
MHRPHPAPALPSLLALVAASLLGACGDETLAGSNDETSGAPADTTSAAPDTAPDSSAAPDNGATPDDAAPDDAAALDTGPAPDDTPLGGDRPARVVLPPDYTADGPARPLLVLLHGYSVSGEIQDFYLGASRRAAERGMITLTPDGTKDASGLNFWNASPGWCCDFGRTGVDDAGYLLALVAEAQTRFTIDPARIFLMGHSNGGFMSYKLACEHADVFAAIAVIAGSMPLAESDCAPSEPVSVLHIHGTVDATIFYPGVPDRYPGAETATARWAAHGGCELLPSPGPSRDYDNAVLGAETYPHPYPGCAAGHAVELWEMRASGHVPGFNDAFMPDVLAWLLAHPSPE